MTAEMIQLIETLGLAGALACASGYMLWKTIQHILKKTDAEIKSLEKITIKLIDKLNKVDDNLIELKSSTQAIVDFMKNGQDSGSKTKSKK